MPQKKRTPKKSAPGSGAAILLFFGGVLLLLLCLIQGSQGWRTLHDLCYMSLGLFAPAFALDIVFAAALWALGGLYKYGHKLWQTALTLWLLSAWLHIALGSPTISVAIKNAPSLKGGGVAGYLLGGLLEKLLGGTGAVILIILAVFVLVMFLFGITLVQLLTETHKAGKGAAKAAVSAKNYVAASVPRRPRNIDIPGPTDDATPRKKSLAEPAPLELDDIPLPSDDDAPYSEESYVPPEIHIPKRKPIASAPSMPDTPRYSGSYSFPPLSLLKLPKMASNVDASRELKQNSVKLIETLKSFGVDANVINISRGPTVTRYEVQPKIGVKISKITGLSDDIALNLSAAGVRIEAPIPGKPAVGIEIPNKINETVTLRELVSSETFDSAKSDLSVALGKDISGQIVLCDLAKLPHILISGTTGSGKSVCVNSIIVSLLYKSSPEDVQLVMIDPKKVELGGYAGIPHLASPVVSDPRKAAGALNWAVQEMLRRYKLFAETGARDIDGYNAKVRSGDAYLEADGEQIELTKLPRFVIVIDELADLMMAAPSEVETSICRLAQMARAAGMHLVIATQRPSVDVVTGLIKANIPSRIALKVSSQVDSRTMIDGAGAEKLLGNGDMLYSPVGIAKPMRVQGCYVSDSEIEAVINYIKKHGAAQDVSEIAEEIERLAPADKKGGGSSAADDDEADSRLIEAIECVLECGEASASLLQRRLKLGYARAGRIIDQLEQRGYIGPSTGNSKPREVRVTHEQLAEMLAMRP